MSGRPVEIEYLLRDGVSPGLNRIERYATSMGRTVEREGDKIDKMFRNMILPAGAVIGMRQFARSIEEVYSETQALESSFDVLLGGKGVPGFIAALKEFAVDSPLSLTGVSNAAQTLLGFNVEAGRVIPIIRQIGDVSMGNEEKFRSLALAYAQVHSTGKLMGQDLLQMINAGFNPLTVIAEKTGKSVGVLKEEMAAGAISAQTVADAFVSATSEGGKFFGMTQKQAEGIKGLKAQLEGAMQDAQSSIGENNEAIIAGSYKAAIAVVQNYEKVGKIILGMVATYGAYRTAVIVATAAEKGWTIAQMLHFKALVIVEKAQKLLNMTMLANPYVLATTLLVGLVATMWALKDSSTAAERAQEQLNKRQQEFNDQEQNRRSRIEELIRIIQDETQTTYAQITAWDELIKLSPAIKDAYTREQLAVADLTDANKALNAEQDKRNADRLISDIENAKKSIAGLKEQFNRMASTPDSGFGLLRIAKQIEDQEAGLAILEQNLVDHNRRVAEAEFNALPPAEKIKIKEEQLARIRSEFEKVNEVINEEMAKLQPQEVQIPIPLRVEVTGDQRPQGWRPYNSTPGTMWGPQSLGMQQARADALRSDEAATQAEIDALKAASDTRQELSEEEKKRLDEEARRRREQAQRDADALKKLEVQFADDLAQARIDAMTDGLEKTLAQNDENHRRELAQIEEQRSELLAARQKTLPNGQTATLTDNEQAGFTAMIVAADVERDRANQDARKKEEERLNAEADRLNAMLRDYQTYQQRMTEIAAKYSKERENVMAAGGSEENIALVGEAEQAAIDALNLEYAEKESTFRAWMNQLATQTLDELRVTLEKAKQALDAAKASGATDQQLARGYAAVNEAQKAVNRAEEAAVRETPSERKFQSWQKLYGTLQKVESEFSDIGEAIGGVSGDAIKTAGTIATSTLAIIGGIQQYALLSMQMTQLTAGTTAMAIKQVERASVILAIIGVVIQVIQTMTGLFKDNEQALQDAANAAREYKNALDEIARSKRYDLFDTVFGSDGIGKFQEAKKISIETLKDIQKQVDDIQNRTVNIFGHVFANPIEATYDGRSGWNKLWGSGDHKIKNYVFDINDYINSDGSLKLKELQAWYDAYENGLDDSEKQILQDLIENGTAYEEAMQVMTDHIDQLWGNLASSIAENMIDAFLETGDAAANLGELVDDVARNMGKSMIESLLVKDIFNEDLKTKLLDLLTIGDQEGANALIQDAIESAGELAPIIEGIITSLGVMSDKAVTQSGQSGAYQTMSQDTGTKLEGLFTAMRMSMEDMKVSIDNIGPGLSEATGVLIEIRDEVKTSNTWLGKIYERIERIIRDGLKVA